MKNYQIIALVLFVLLLGAALLVGVVRNKKTQEVGIMQDSTPLMNEDTPNGVFRVIPDESKIIWQASKELVKNYTDEGTIGLASAQFTFDEGNLKKGETIIDMTTIETTRTGLGGKKEGLTSHLKQDDFFAVDTYPRARFTVTTASRTDTNIYEVTGKMTIRGITATETIQTTIKNQEEQLSITGNTSIDRTDYGIKYNSDKFFKNLGDRVIEDEFNLTFELMAEKVEK